MESITRTCQGCKQNFVIEADDRSFYEKMHVPLPTFCVSCRAQRRFTWRNERTLYKRECDLCHKSVIGLYPPRTPFPVYCNECWFSDSWDPFAFGATYNFSKPFFEQFKELSDKVPRLAIWIQQSTNSDYTNQSYSNRNAYLSFALRDSEDVSYICRAVQLKQCMDSTYTHHSEGLYQCLDTDKSYRSIFLDEAEGCVESGFLSNSRNCQNCFGGVNLRSATHVFFGEQLDKDSYDKRMERLDLGSRITQEVLQKKLAALKRKSIFKFATLTNTMNVKGDHLSNAKNCNNVFDGFELENARYSSWVFTSKEISDCYGMGGSEFAYEGIGVEEVHNIKFASVTDGSHDVTYTDMCSASSNLFGCVGLRNKEYCILNTQYSKEEYEKLVPQIIAQMSELKYTDKAGRTYGYGEFFPAELSVFAYNETVAQENFPLTKKEAEALGYRWKDEEERHYAITLQAEDVPDNISEVADGMTNETIGCAHGGKCNDQCTTAFKIIPAELQFYKKIQAPLPTLCPNCRHYERLKMRNPKKLWHRVCECGGPSAQREGQIVYKNVGAHSHGAAPCKNEFETSYAPERPEIVYCEQCYQAEVV